MSKATSVGLSLGAFYSCVGIFNRGQVEIIYSNEGEIKFPICSEFPDSERLIEHLAISLNVCRNFMAAIHHGEVSDLIYLLHMICLSKPTRALL